MTNKNFIKRISAILCFLLILFSVPAFTAFADEASQENDQTPTTEFLTKLDTTEDLMVSFWYDSAFPSVTLISPSGIRYKIGESTAGIEHIIEDEYAIVKITAASAGNWYIEYTMGTNTEFEFSVMGSAESIWIQYINVTPSTTNYCDVEFLAERGDSYEEYRYELYLSYDADSADQVLLESGYAYTGEEVYRSVYLGEYNSYEKYKMILQVEMQTPDVTLFDSLESNVFSFVNTNTPSAPSNMEITVDVTERIITIDWSKYTSYRYDGYRLLISGGAGETIFGSDLDSGATKLSQYITNAYTSITVTLYGKDGSVLSAPLTKQIKVGGAIELLTEELTSSSQAQIKMNLNRDVKLTVTVGENKNEFVSEGKENTVAVALENGNNTLNASYTEDNVTYIIKKDIFKDGYAPVIDFYEPYADMSFIDKKAVLVGSVGDASKFLLNGSEIELKDGQFSVTVELEDGENTLLFEAYDAAGNRSEYPMTLYGGKTNIAADGILGTTEHPQWIAIAIGGGIALAFIIFAIVLCIIKKKLKAFSTVSLIVFFSFATALTAGGYVYHLIRQDQLSRVALSYDFSVLANDSLEKAYAVLTQLEQIKPKVESHLIYLIVSAFCLLAAIAAHVVIKLITKKLAAKKPAVEQVQKASDDNAEVTDPQESSSEKSKEFSDESEALGGDDASENDSQS